MASVLSRIQIIMEANTANYNNELRRARENSSKTFSSIAKGAGKMALGAGVAIAGIGVTALKTAGEFEAAMQGVKAVSNATGEDFTKLRDLARELGATTQYNAKEAANGMEELAKAGFNTSQILESVPSVLSLASAGAIELAQSAGIVADVLGGMSLGAEHSARVADVLAKAAASSAVDVAGLGDSMTNVASVAATMGQDLETTTALLGSLGDKAITGGQAGTQLKGVMLNLMESKDGLQELGIAVSDGSGNIRSMIDIISDLGEATKNLSPEEKIALYDDLVGKINITGLASLVDTADSGTLQVLKEKLDTAKGSAKEMADIRMEGLEGSIKGLDSAWYDLKIELTEGGAMQFAANLITNMADAMRAFTKTLPAVVANVKQFVDKINLVENLSTAFDNLVSVIKAIGDVLAPVVEWFREHDKFSRALAISIALVATAFGVYAASVWVGTVAMTAFATVMAIATAPLTAIVIALVAVTAAGVYLYQNWDTIKEKGLAVWQSLKDSVSGFVDGVIESFKGFVTGITDAFSSVGSFFSNMWQSVTESSTGFIGSVVEGFNSFKARAVEVFDSLKQFISDTWQSIKTSAVEVFNTMPEPVQEMGRNILSVFTSLTEGVRVAFSLVTAVVVGAIEIAKSAWLSITSAFDIAVGSVKAGLDVLKGYVSAVFNTISGIVAGAVGIATSAWASITAVFNTAIGAIKSGFDTASGYVSAAFQVISNVATTVLGIATAGLNALGGVFTSAFEGMKSTASSILSAIVGVVKAQFEGMKAVAMATLSAIAAVFNTGFNLVKNTVQTVMNVIKALIRGDMQGVVTAFRTGFSNAVSIVKTGVNNILSTFKTLGSKLLQVGKDAITGFINGIKSKIADTLNVVGNFVESVKNAFTKAKAFDIRSPSRVTKKIGKHVGEGFAIGLDETIGSAVAVADSMVNAIKASFDVMKGYTMIDKDFDKTKANLEANKSLASSIATLRKEIVLFGDNSKVASAIYDASMGSMSYASKEFIDEYIKGLKEIERLELEAADKVIEDNKLKQRESDYKSLVESLTSEDEKRLQVLKTQLALIEAMAEATDKSVQSSKLLSSMSKVDAYSSVYNTNTQSTGETNLSGIRKSYEDSEVAYLKQKALLDRLEQTEEVEQAITDLEYNQSEKRKLIARDELEANKAIYSERVDIVGSAYDTLAGVVKGFAGENSRVYKAMFAIQKAHTLASILLKSKEALSIAWASAPFPMNLGAVAMAALKTGALQAAANAITPPSISGQAHDGLDYVPKEGTYILDKGERVVKPYDNQRLSKFLDNSEGSGSTNITTNVTVTGDGKADVSSNNKLGKDLGQAITAAIQKQLRQEQRQGGMLAR